MPGPKFALTTLTVGLGLTALALPRTALDAAAVQRRQAAKQRLAALDETVRLHRTLIAGGACDPNTAFNVLQVEKNRCELLKEIDGVTPRLLREYEQLFRLGCRLYVQTRSPPFRQSEMCGTDSQLWLLAREVKNLRDGLGLPPGDEGTILKQTIGTVGAARHPAPDDGTARLSLPTLSVRE